MMFLSVELQELTQSGIEWLWLVKMDDMSSILYLKEFSARE